MILKSLIISLIITAIYSSMQEGMLLGNMRIGIKKFLDSLGFSDFWHKPFCDCLTCMGGIYTVILYPLLYGFSMEMLPTMLVVIGLNSIISKFLSLEL